MTDDGYFSGANYDPETVRFFDVAHAGAHIRTIAAHTQYLSTLRGTEFRAVAILPTDQIAHATAELTVELISPLTVPITIADRLPLYVGPLDLVVVVGERADADWASLALIEAARRGATTVLIGPSRGPIHEDAPEDTITFPVPPTAGGAAPSRYLAGLVALQWSVTQDEIMVADKLHELADAADAELEQLSPERDVTVNPGRELRDFVEGARVVHTGSRSLASPDFPHRVEVGLSIARCAATLFSAHGLAGEFLEPELIPVVLDRQPSSPASDDIFHDPFLDGEKSQVPLKIIVWGQAESHLPGSLAVACTDTDTSDLVCAVQLLTRAFAATAYDISKED
ncbi:hypothetical protein ACG98H_08545 [Corynebacterium sp. L4756]|uniref:hypothetical protein n=1 Tax=unclassified Corynebacterium TaxID=2624378 RepID=UPI00374CAB25